MNLLELKEKLKQLQMLMIENNVINVSKEELNIEIDKRKIQNEILQDENSKYQSQINKVKKARKMLSLYTAIYYILIMVLVSINLTTAIFLNHILSTLFSFGGITLTYLYMVYDDVKVLSNNDINFYKRMIKENNHICKENEIVIKLLDGNLRDYIKRSYQIRCLVEEILNELNKNCINSVDSQRILDKKDYDNNQKSLTKKL